METESDMFFLLEIFLISVLVIFITPFLLHMITGLLPGVSSFIVTSGSMEPEIPTGSVIYTHEITDYSDIENGDVITFEEGNQYITHRVYDIQQNSNSFTFITKGDSNNDPDNEPVSQERVVGKVFLTVPYLGIAINAVSSFPGIALLVILPALLVIAIETKNIVDTARIKK